MSNTNTQNTQNSTLSTKSFPRNIYSFSSAKAKRDLSFRSVERPALDKQIELFEQQTLFGPEFDVIEEMTLNSNRYLAFGTDKQQISIYGVPSIVSYNIDRIQHKLPSKISSHPITAACTSFGISQLYKNPHVRDLAYFRSQLLEDHIANGGRDVLEFYQLLKVFKIDIPDDSGGLKSEKTNILIPEWVAQSLGGLAKSLGAPISSLLIICVMLTLSIQETVIEVHKKQLAQSVDTFLGRVELRKRIAALLLDAL